MNTTTKQNFGENKQNTIFLPTNNTFGLLQQKKQQLIYTFGPIMNDTIKLKQLKIFKRKIKIN